jgi:hypothetical protein
MALIVFSLPVVHHSTGLDSVEREVRCLVGFPVEGFFVDGRSGTGPKYPR